MITTIIFALSEVYLHGMFGIEQVIEELVGMPVSNDSLHSTTEAEKFFHGQITEAAFWRALIQKHHWPITVTELKKLIRAHMTEIDGTRAIIEKLKENGYKLGLLSVHTKEWVEHCETKFGYHQLFQSVMYSFEVGLSKPDPKAFELVLEKLQAKPAECLFIDDSERNVQAAQQLGMQAIQFQDPQQLEQELKQLQIRL